MRRKSLFAFSLVNTVYDNLADEIEKFVLENAPSEDEETEGFINFYKHVESERGVKYIYFEFYQSYLEEKTDPRGARRYRVPVKLAHPIAITQEPFMLMIFSRNPAIRDKILEKLPIKPEHRSGIAFSQDFIEFINTPTPEEWAKEVFKDVIEPRGRKGRKEKTHIITEEYSGPDEREITLERKGYVFREFAKVMIGLEDASIYLTVYPSGKITVWVPGPIELRMSVPLIAQAIKELKNAESRYFNLKTPT